MSDHRRDISSSEGLFVRAPKVGAMRDPLEADWNVALGQRDAVASAEGADVGATDSLALIDFSLMNGIFENFLEVVGLPVAIIDLKGLVLASSRWQRLCMDFHRVAKGTLARCLESDISLSRDMAEGKSYSIYRCRNGLTDCATPIVVEGVHVANLFVGQFLLAPPDLESFRQQQEEFGFDKEAYFKALTEVPIVSEHKLPAILKLMGGLAQQIARQSLTEQRVRASYAIVEKQVAERTRDLAEAHDRLRKIAAQVPGLVYQFMQRADGSFCIPYASDAIRTMFGLEPEEVRDDAAGMFAAVHPDDLNGFVAAARASAATLTPWRHDFRVRRPDGSVRWLGGDSVPQRNSDGATVWHGFITDNTERKRTQMLLEGRLRLASFSAAHPLHDLLTATLDEMCRLTEAEVGFYHFLLPDQETLSLQAWSTRTTREFCSASAEPGHYDLAMAGVWADSVRQRRSVVYNDYPSLPNRKGLPDGHAEVRRLMSVPIFRDGRIMAIIGVGNKPTAFDSDDLMVAETLADMAWDLAQRKLAEEAAEARAKELEASNSDLEQFAYVASHDLRQPLRMVNSYLALIERRYGDLLDEDGHQFIGYARDGALKMNCLILDLLEYSRLGRHGQPPERVSLTEAAAGARDSVQILIDETACLMEIGTEPAFVVANRAEIVRLFQNLMGNAIKYRAPDRRPHVVVGWRQHAGEWLISVRDNGIGIEREFSRDIFKIFSRLHTSQEYEGTGIGLAVCQKIVNNHGGRIWVESEDATGSTFFFTIPAAS